jgi:hypothetical protein
MFLKRERREADKTKTKIVNSVDKTFDYMSAYLKYISFLLLPIYALAFKLLYIRSKRYYIDHLVYTLHVQSFAYIIVSPDASDPTFHFSFIARLVYGSYVVGHSGVYTSFLEIYV